MRSVLCHALAFVALTLSALTETGQALACAGPELRLRGLEPRDGAQSVPLGVQPVLVGAVRWATLRTGTGTVVPVEQVVAGRVQPPGFELDASAHFVSYPVTRLVPSAPLAPDSEYTLEVQGGVEYDGAVDAGPPQLSSFRTASAAAPAPGVPVVPAGFGLEFRYVEGASDTECDHVGQLTLSGWDDRTLLEVCFDYYVTLSDGPEAVQARSDCTLAWHPHTFMLSDGRGEFAEDPMWIERVRVRALALDGQVSAPRGFERGAFAQTYVRSSAAAPSGSRTAPIEVIERDGRLARAPFPWQVTPGGEAQEDGGSPATSSPSSTDVAPATGAEPAAPSESAGSTLSPPVRRAHGCALAGTATHARASPWLLLGALALLVSRSASHRARVRRRSGP